MRWKATAMLWGVIASAMPAAADPLTLDGAVKLALEKNLSLQRSAVNLLGAKRTADNAWGVLVPSTSFSTGLSRTNNAYTVTGASADPSWNQTAAAGVSLSLPSSLFTNLAQAQLAYQSGTLTYDTARRSLEKSDRLAFGSLLLEDENIKLSEQNLDRKQTSYNDTQTKYKSGLASDLDVLSAQVAVETLKPSLQRLRATYLNDLGQFKVLLGISTGQDVTLTGSLDEEIEKNLQIDAVSKGADESPDVREAQLALRSAQLGLDSTRLSSWLPTTSFSWTSQPSRTLTSGSKWTDSTGALSLTLSYSLDSFFWWTTKSTDVASAEDTVKTSRSELDETKTNQRADARERRVRLIRQAVESLATQRLNLALAQKTYDLTRDAYQRGTKDLLTLQNSEGDLNQAHYDLLSQRYALISAVIDLEYELNLPFGTLWGEEIMKKRTKDRHHHRPGGRLGGAHRRTERAQGRLETRRALGAPAAGKALAATSTVYSVKTQVLGNGQFLRDYLELTGDVVTETNVDVFPDTGGRLAVVHVQVGYSMVKGKTIIAEVDPSKPGASYAMSPVYEKPHHGNADLAHRRAGRHRDHGHVIGYRRHPERSARRRPGARDADRVGEGRPQGRYHLRGIPRQSLRRPGQTRRPRGRHRLALEEDPAGVHQRRRCPSTWACSPRSSCISTRVSPKCWLLSNPSSPAWASPSSSWSAAKPCRSAKSPRAFRSTVPSNC